jgi:DHA1 family bicyclomycin/chloramphenicol resistance-like MFS transporter
MAVIPGLAGTAAGIGTFLQFFLGAVFAQLYGLLADGTPGPMIATTAGASLLGLAMAIVPLLLARRDRPG